MECGAQIELGSMQSCMSRVTPGPALRSGGKPPPLSFNWSSVPPPLQPHPVGGLPGEPCD